MSFNLTLTEAIDDIIQQFILKIAEKYTLDQGEIIKLWNINQSVKILETPKKLQRVMTETPSEPQVNVEESELLKCNKTQLIAMCKTYGHKCSGTKDILISRLLGKTLTDEKKVVSTKVGKAKVASEKLEATPVVKKLTSNIPDILIKRNNFNNYEHIETGFIYNNDTKTIIGKQKSDGSIEDLTEDDIDKCNAFKFKYDLPKNLDHKLTLEDVKVDELDEEEEEEEDEDLEVDIDESKAKEDEDEEEDEEDDEELIEEELLEEDDIDVEDEDEDEDE